jgi:hypothetical protein
MGSDFTYDLAMAEHRLRIRLAEEYHRHPYPRRTRRFSWPGLRHRSRRE